MKLSKFVIYGIGVGILTALFRLGYDVITDDEYDTATYRIESGNDKIYYANTFRMYGRGITFDSVDGKKIILTGDIDIEYIKKEN